ncbi:zinc-dependent metalloprotease [Aliiglaciecola litoralis]|uniref:Zinc-dependent metalloprotease n=1 Tax=Aliiglaciecola litoralis TaxID=582857 RepID=A0ABP3WNQ7_9ALTE
MIKYFCLCLILFSSIAFASPLKIDEFTQGMDVKKGFYTFYYQSETGQVFLEIGDFASPFLFQSSLPQGIGSNDIGLDRGQLGATRLVQFERFGSKVLLKQLNTDYRVSSDNMAERASIDEAFADSVIAGLSIVAAQNDVVLVDYTDFLLSDIHGISVRLQDTKQGSYAIDKNRSGVYLPRSKSFPDNTELEALVTFGGSKPGQFVKQVSPAAESISVNLHHSLIRLPDSNYQPRAFHPYSGYWKVSYQDYSVAIDKPMEQKFIPRHRLQKKQPDAASSEAVEPIVYYLDPGIPEPIKSALHDGAKWWDQAFEKIGYKNAFQVKTLPADADPMDVRYNVIQWVHRATRGWSYGSSVIDPRTGEILKGHVTLGSLRVRQDYLIALGLTSPFKSDKVSTEAQKQMALARIRQLSAHEVGHTLGIAHNFAASADNRGSVMDYPHPKVSVVDGQVSLDDAYAVGMGEWDYHTIAYGYQDLSEDQQEADYLSGLIAKAHQNKLAYQSDPDARPKHAANAKGHLWDNGADPLEELAHLIEVRKTALNQFGINSIPKGDSLASLQEVLVPIYYMHRYQLDAVAKLIGGVNYQYESKGDFEQPQGISSVDHKLQQRALTAMLNTLSARFLQIPNTVTTLITPKVYGEQNSRESFQGRNGLVFDPISAAEASAGNTMALLLQTQRLNRIASQPIHHKDQLTIASLLEAVFATTIKQSEDKFNAQIKRRVDYVVLTIVMQAMQAGELAPEARAMMLVNIEKLHTWLKNNKRNPHYRAMALQLDWFMQTGEWKGGFEIKPMPPGSPI